MKKRRIEDATTPPHRPVFRLCDDALVGRIKSPRTQYVMQQRNGVLPVRIYIRARDSDDLGRSWIWWEGTVSARLSADGNSVDLYELPPHDIVLLSRQPELLYDITDRNDVYLLSLTFYLTDP